MASDYQGETIQVFVFFQGKFLGYQCFGQDRITLGGAAGMDLPLPECTEDQGYWDVYVSRGALYVWYRGPAGGEGGERPEDPRKVQPLDSFSLGGYRFQAKLLEAQGLVQPPAMRHEEAQDAGSCVQSDPEGESGPEPAPEPPDEVQGISVEYARSIWSERQTADREEKPGGGEGPPLFVPDAEARPARETEPDRHRSFDREADAEPGCANGAGPDDILSLWGLSESEGAGGGKDEAIEAEGDGPETPEQEASGARDASEWIGFGQEEKVSPEGGAFLEAVRHDAQREEPLTEMSGEEEPVILTEEQGAAESCGIAGGTCREEQTRFWDDMGREAFSLADEIRGKPEADVCRAEPCPVGGTGDLCAEEGEVGREPNRGPAEEPVFRRERLEGVNTAVEVDEAGIEERAEKDGQEDEDEDVTYFSLVKQVFPRRGQPAKTPRGQGRALEVVRFRGGDVQDVGYLESGNAYTLRKGWSRSLWKRRGGIPPNFTLVRLKNGGLAEIHIREAVNGRLYSDSGSQDIRVLRGVKQGRFGRKSQASWLPLPADTWALLRVDSGRYLVRYVPPRPKPAAQPLRPNVSTGQFKLVSMSVLSHILLILVIGLVVPDRTLEGYSHVDHFARIDPDALKALKPPPPPKKLDEPKPLETKDVSRPKPKPVPPRQRPVPTPEKSRVPEKKQVDLEQTGLLAALGGPDSGVSDANANSAILLAAVTNLDAVAVPSDTTTFNLAGIAGRLATSEIQVPTSDVIETVGAARLIKQGDGTLGAMASRSTGEVKAVVHEPPRADISIRGGMSREAVLKVVNAHLDEIRDCYERELLHRPGISGKILMEWLIQLDGSVRYAKIKFTNIGHSSDLHGCIQAQVVTWTFPRPTGGEEVLVTFPFLFESIGF